VVDRCVNEALRRELGGFGVELVGPSEATASEATLTQAAQGFADGVTCCLNAIAYMRSEDQPGAADPQEDELLYLEADADPQIERLGTRLLSRFGRATDQTAGAFDLEATLAFNLYDGNDAFLGELTFTQDSLGLGARDGCLTMSDGTVLALEWMDIGPDHTVAIDLRGRTTWRQVWLEGTFTADRQGLKEGTMDCWGDGTRFITPVTGQRVREPARHRTAPALPAIACFTGPPQRDYPARRTQLKHLCKKHLRQFRQVWPLTVLLGTCKMDGLVMEGVMKRLLLTVAIDPSIDTFASRHGAHCACRPRQR
jgi:hypothetical protein